MKHLPLTSFDRAPSTRPPFPGAQEHSAGHPGHHGKTNQREELKGLALVSGELYG